MLKILRPAMRRGLRPLGRGLARIGVTPNMVTAAGTAGAVAGALVLYPLGYLFLGTVVITFFVLFDMLDGAVARATGGESRWGAFLDSTMDRFADAGVFAGLLMWLMVSGDRPLAAVTLFCLVSGFIVSYVKARAEGLGVRCEAGIAERTERLVIALVAIGLGGLGVPYILAGGLWLLAGLNSITVAQRLVEVRARLRVQQSAENP